MYSSSTTAPEVGRQGLSSVACRAWAIHDESRGEPIQGQRAVLDVVIARAKKRKLSSCEIIMQPRQFSGYNGQELVVTEEMLARYWKVARMKPVVEGCDYFHAKYVHPAWTSKMKQCKVVGNQKFYKLTKEK